MTVVKQIQELLEERLHPTHLEIQNDSDKHAGHRGSPDTGNSHFTILIVSPDFDGKTRISRHQLVYECLAKLMNKPIHALSIKAYTPIEFTPPPSGE